MMDELITTEELATRLGRAEITVRDWVKHGVLKGYRLPGSNLVFLKTSEIAEALVPYRREDDPQDGKDTDQ